MSCRQQQWAIYRPLDNWMRLQKLDISMSAVGQPQGEMYLDPIAHIPVVRLRSEQGMMYIIMPIVALWRYLWLEAPSINCKFRDFTRSGVSQMLCPVFVPHVRHLRMIWACSVPEQTSSHTSACDLFAENA